MSDEVNIATALGRQASVVLPHRRASMGSTQELAHRDQCGEVHALLVRGDEMLACGRRSEALALFERALSIDPSSADALSCIGNLLLLSGRRRDSLVFYERALAHRQENPHALNGRAVALFAMRRYGEAAKSFRSALRSDPGYRYARGAELNARLHACDWTARDSLAAAIAWRLRRGEPVCTPFSFLAISSSLEDQLRCARVFVADRCAPAPQPMWRGERYRHDRVRIAYLSADFHRHATAFLMARLFDLHDRGRFEVFAYSFGPDQNSEMRSRLRDSFDRFVDVSAKSDREVASMLRNDEIDIAVDLKGFTQDSRTGILAHRAVPVQVNYLGYPGTMGAPYIDYLIGDATVTPPEHDRFYAERIVRLPDTYQVNDERRPIGTRRFSRAAVGLPERGFVFCCFNNNYKITPPVFDVWMRLLSKVEGSVLWLLEDNTEVSGNLRGEARRRGVDPARIVFAPRMTLTEHLARHRCADLFLDTLPYGAHTTASDALWTGLPVLTCLGPTFAGRVAASLLNAVGLPELITANLAEYERRALDLATRAGRLEGIRGRLAGNRLTHPLFDTDRFRRHIESAYQTMHERHQRGLPAQSFTVAPIS